MMNIRKLTFMTMLVAIAVAGSVFISFPAGIARAYPIQHAINVIAAVLLGPVPAVGVAFVTSLIRLLTGTGSLLAFPGSMIGALLAGILYQKFGKPSIAAVGEIIGTGVIASLLAVPYAKILMGTTFAAFFFVPPFLVSSISGAVIGAVLVVKLQQVLHGDQLKQLTN